MNRRSTVLTDGPAFREARELKLLTLDAVSDAMIESGMDCISKNSVWKTESGGPVSFKTVELLCQFYGREPRVVKLQGGQLRVEPATIDNELQQIAKTVRRLVMEDISGETTEEELLSRLTVLQQLIGDEVIRMSNFKLGSLHFEAEVSLNAAELIDELFPKNLDGEHVVPNLLDDEVYLGLKDLLFFRHTSRCLLDEAVDKFASCSSWTEFYRHFFGVEGRVRECFPSHELRQKFEQSAEHDELLEMVAAMRSTHHGDSSSTAEPERMITVRLPRSVHEVLMNEADAMNTSVNRLAVSKLMRPIPQRLVAVHQHQQSRRRIVRSVSKPIAIPECDIVWLVVDESENIASCNEQRIGSQGFASELRSPTLDHRIGSHRGIELFFSHNENELQDLYIECDRSLDSPKTVCTVVESRLSVK